MSRVHEVSESEVAELLELLRDLSARPRLNRARQAGLLALTWVTGVLLGLAAGGGL